MKNFSSFFLSIITVIFLMSLAVFSCEGGSDDPATICTNGETRSCGETDVGICSYGTQTCSDSSWGTCMGQVLPVETEACDGLDDDCDGEVDEDFDTGSSCLALNSPCGAGTKECSGVGDSTLCSTEAGGSAFIGTSISCDETLTSETTAGKTSIAELYSTCTDRDVWPGNEAVYSFIPSISQSVTVTVSGLSADLDLLVLEGTCTGTACEIYSEQANTASESITFAVSAGTQYYLIVDSKDAAVTGSFDISVACGI